MTSPPRSSSTLARQVLCTLSLAVFFLVVPTGCQLPPGALKKTAGPLTDSRGKELPTIETKSPLQLGDDPKNRSLQECVSLALQLNKSRPVARSLVAAAEAQHRQAMAAYWPQITAKVAAQMRDQDLNFLQPEMNVPVSGLEIDVPSMTVQTQASALALPANALGKGFPSQAVKVPIPSQQIEVGGQTLTVDDIDIHVPERKITHLDNTIGTAGAELKWLLWDGGNRKATANQARSGIAIAKEEERRSELEVIRDVKRYYYAAVLARKLLKVARDTHSRMNSTLELTEKMYKNGSEKVLKTDYLRNKVLVETLNAMIQSLEGNRELSEAALTFAMGLNWNERVEPGETSLPVESAGELESFVSNAYEFSPDWRKLEVSLDALAQSVTVAKAGHMPKLALTGNLHTFTTGNNGVGMATDENRKGWTVGLGFEIPLWDGFLTKNRVAEAKARLDSLRHRRLQLEQGLALQVKSGFIRVSSTARQYTASTRALASARENRDLSEKGMAVEMVEVDDVFESQFLEALAEARSLKSAYDHVAARAELEFTVGDSATRTLASLQ